MCSSPTGAPFNSIAAAPSLIMALLRHGDCPPGWRCRPGFPVWRAPTAKITPSCCTPLHGDIGCRRPPPFCPLLRRCSVPAAPAPLTRHSSVPERRHQAPGPAHPASHPEIAPEFAEPRKIEDPGHPSCRGDSIPRHSFEGARHAAATIREPSGTSRGHSSREFDRIKKIDVT